MGFRFIQRATVGASIATAGLLTAGCSDGRLEKLSTGISRDSALAIINEGISGDSLARVYSQNSYLLPNTKGNVLLTNVLFYDRKGRKQAEDPNVAPDATTPIVISDGKVIGWGWTYYDSLAKANNIPVTAPK
jgi:hypothetical protein